MNDPESSEISIELIRESERAYLVRWDGKMSWFPKSQVHFTYMNWDKKTGTMSVPDWLLEKKQNEQK